MEILDITILICIFTYTIYALKIIIKHNKCLYCSRNCIQKNKFKKYEYKFY